MMYGLMLQIVFAFLLSFAGVLPYSLGQLTISFFVLLVMSFVSNMVFGKFAKATINAESMVITALLLFFVLDPTILSMKDVLMLGVAATAAEASKYILAYKARHIFNPVAIAAVVLALFQYPLATWWVATPWMFVFSLVFGLMVVRKTRRFSMVGAFAVAATIMALLRGVSFSALWVSWPLVYFGTLMLTEPRTAPARKGHQIVFGAGVGLLFSSVLQIGAISMTPELALCLGNMYAFFVSSHSLMKLTFKSMTCETEQICNFVFTPDHRVSFEPGQYVEWTMPLHAKMDSRGNRRYFTIASAPSETDIHLGVRVDREHGSQFKKDLLALQPGDTITASHVAGEFVMPKDVSAKMVWVAGGIGVTPFRSMYRELLLRKEKRDIFFYYCANSETDFAYKKEFDDECSKVGLCPLYVVAKPTPAWTGKSGFLTKEMIEADIPDYRDRVFYFSGPPMMVQNYVKLVKSMGVPKACIITDYFPGF